MVQFDFYKAPAPPVPDYGALGAATGAAAERQMRAAQFLASMLGDVGEMAVKKKADEEHNATVLQVEREHSASQEKIHQAAIDAAQQVQSAKQEQDDAARKGMMMVLKARTADYESNPAGPVDSAGRPQGMGNRFAPLHDLAQDPDFQDVMSKMRPNDAEAVLRLGSQRQGEMQAQRKAQHTAVVQAHIAERVAEHERLGQLSSEEAADLRMGAESNPAQAYNDLTRKVEQKMGEAIDDDKLTLATKRFDERIKLEPQNAGRLIEAKNALRFSGLKGPALHARIANDISKDYRDKSAEEAVAKDRANTAMRERMLAEMDEGIKIEPDETKKSRLQQLRDFAALDTSPSQDIAKRSVFDFIATRTPKPAVKHEPTTTQGAELEAMRHGTDAQAMQAATLRARRELIHSNPTAFLDENGKPFTSQVKQEAHIAPIIDTAAKELLKLHRPSGGSAAPTGQSFEDWKAKNAPNDSGDDYDLRGAFKAGVVPDAQGHMPDTFKKPNHPTFSVESEHVMEAPTKAGFWEGERFVKPEPGNLKQRALALDASLAGRGKTEAERDAVIGAFLKANQK